jgi:integrase
LPVSSKWSDIDYKNREIIIRGTKTEASLRRLDMCDGLYMTLKGLEAYKTESSYIFHHSNGDRILRRDKMFKRITLITGIKITAKDLRDVFASTIAMGSEKNRPDVQVVSELLGHTNLITTKKYLYSLKEKRMKVVSVLDDIFVTENATDTKNKDLENILSPCNYYGGGAGNRTPDTTDMSRML